MFLKCRNLAHTGLLIVFMSHLFHGSSQTSSFGFSEVVPPLSEHVKTVDSKYFGTYRSENNVQYIFDQDGVFTVSTIRSSMSQKKVRESSKYTVQGDYLFGIEEGDSTPYILRDGRYYFGLQRKTVIVGEGKKNKLTKYGNVYYINFYDYDSYYPSQVAFSAEGLELSHFDYPSDVDLFLGIKNRKKKRDGDLLKISLLPTLKEWEKLPLNTIFGTTVSLRKQNP